MFFTVLRCRDRHIMQLLHLSGNLTMQFVRCLLSVLAEKKLLWTTGLNLSNQFGLDYLIAFRNKCLRPLLGFVVNTIGVIGITAITHPGHNWIFEEGIEPGPNERITHLNLVIQEGERQIPVQGLNPETHMCKLYSQR